MVVFLLLFSIPIKEFMPESTNLPWVNFLIRVILLPHCVLGVEFGISSKCIHGLRDFVQNNSILMEYKNGDCVVCYPLNIHYTDFNV